jgi:hypothetical protein
MNLTAQKRSDNCTRAGEGRASVPRGGGGPHGAGGGPGQGGQHQLPGAQHQEAPQKRLGHTVHRCLHPCLQVRFHFFIIYHFKVKQT